MVLPLLPLYAKTFGVDKHGWELGLLMASFSAMTFLFAPLWGKLSDRIGRRPVIIVGLAASAAFYALFGVAATFGGGGNLADKQLSEQKKTNERLDKAVAVFQKAWETLKFT